MIRSHSRPRAVAAFVLAALSVAGCVAPSTNLGSVSPDAVRAEQLRQQQLVITSDLELQRRVDDIGYELLRAAVPLCGDLAGVKVGIRFANLHAWTREYQPAASALGFNDTLMVVGVARGSAADRAGVRVGDRVTEFAGSSAPVGRNALRDLGRAFARWAEQQHSVLAFGLRSGPLHASTRGGMIGSDSMGLAVSAAGRALDIPADTVCNFNLAASKAQDLNAWADGQNVTVTSAMLRFAADDDELATILAHEIAHNAMRHIDAKKTNTTLGALFGALLDVAAASQGVNTGGEFTSHGAQIGAMVFSQDFEREADYVGLYVLARAGRSIESAPNFWRRLAQENPGSIKYASTHPTTAERFVRLEEAAAEIRRKIEAGEPLMPELRETRDSR